MLAKIIAEVGFSQAIRTPDIVNLKFLTDSRPEISFTKISRANTRQQPEPDGVEEKKHPAFYLDTNVMMDVHRERNTSSAVLLNSIDNNGWACFASMLAFMEMIDNEQDEEYVRAMREDRMEYSKICRKRHQRELPPECLKEAEDGIKGFFTQYPFILPVSLNDKGWDLALHIASSSTIFAPDAVHLAAAWTSGCDLLVTNDSYFVKQSTELLKSESVSDRLGVCPVEDVEKKIYDMGFKVII